MTNKKSAKAAYRPSSLDDDTLSSPIKSKPFKQVVCYGICVKFIIGRLTKRPRTSVVTSDEEQEEDEQPSFSSRLLKYTKSPVKSGMCLVAHWHRSYVFADCAS